MPRPCERASTFSFTSEPSFYRTAGATPTAAHGLASSGGPGSKSRAQAYRGPLGSWESRRSPWKQRRKKRGTGRTRALALACHPCMLASRPRRCAEGTRNTEIPKVALREPTRSGARRAIGSLSGFIVPTETREIQPEESLRVGKGPPGYGAVVGTHGGVSDPMNVSTQQRRIAEKRVQDGVNSIYAAKP